MTAAFGRGQPPMDEPGARGDDTTSPTRIESLPPVLRWALGAEAALLRLLLRLALVGVSPNHLEEVPAAMRGRSSNGFSGPLVVSCRARRVGHGARPSRCSTRCACVHLVLVLRS